MKKIFYSILALLVFMTTSCSDDRSLEDLSIDPNNPVVANAALLTTNAQVSILGQFGTGYDRYAGAFVQTFAGNHATGVNADQYNIQNNTFQGAFNAMYSGGFRDCVEIIKVYAPENGAVHHGAIAKVLLATGLGHLTDIFGDIPYSEALNSAEFLNPKYDSQEDIYNTIFTLLQEAVSELDQTSTVTVGGEDLVFGGDVSKWKATAYLLLARYNNHLSKKDAGGSATKALDFVDKAKAAGLASNAGNYQMNYSASDAAFLNPWFILWQNNLIIASENFVNLLLNTNDPRALAYWDTQAFPVPGGATFDPIVGKPNGQPTGSASYSPVGPNTYYGKNNSPVLLATYFELLFIEAEAALRSGDATRAATAHNEAIAASMDLLRPTILANGTTEADITTYQASFGAETSGSITIDKIMEEKYKAMFTMNVETWVDLRRHDFQYPSYLALPANAMLTEFIRRGLYPQTELNTNNANVPSGLTLTSKVWWDQ